MAASGRIAFSIRRSWPQTSRVWRLRNQFATFTHCSRQYSSEAGSPASSISPKFPSTVEANGRTFPTDSWFNVPNSVLDLTSRQLHVRNDHPISITRSIIQSGFPEPTFKYYNDLHPVVSTHENFDSLGFPPDHPGRSRSDTYYINEKTLLRTHTSAHESELIGAAESDGFLISADVYRRDEIDRSHYPAFHQMEGVRMWDRNMVRDGDVAAAVLQDLALLPRHNVVVEDPNPPFHSERNPLQAEHHSAEEAEAIATHLKRSLELMVVNIFGYAQSAALRRDPNHVSEPLRMRWVEAYFPFTSPSWELEVYYDGDWLEVLGCGVTKQEIYINAGQPSRLGWAFGLGLDRIAMILFQISDIRVFWSKDERFMKQFKGVSADPNLMRRFMPFSRYPACPRDVSFWLPTAPAEGSEFHENDLMEIVRDAAGDSVEDVKLVDSFTHPKTGRRSMCYRINYRSLGHTLTNVETNVFHDEVTRQLVDKFAVEIR